MAKGSGKLKLSLIGCGRRGLSALAPAMMRYAQKHPNEVELTAACDTEMARAQEACDRFGFGAACDDIAAMFRDHSPKVALLALPPAEMAMQGAQLLVQNTSCLFELPLGAGPDDAMELSEAAREMNTPHVVLLNRRVHPLMTRALKWAGQLGQIKSVRVAVTTGQSMGREFLCGTGVHVLDMMCHILGRIEKFGMARDENKFTVSVAFSRGLKGQFNIQAAADVDEEVFELSGSGFRALVATRSQQGPFLQCWRKKRLEIKIMGQEVSKEAIGDGAYELLAEFIRAVRLGSKPIPTIEDVMPALDVAGRIADKLEKE